MAGRRVFVAGHRGMVGSAVVRRLAGEGCEILTATRQEVDLRRQSEVEDWLSEKRPSAVFLTAATVGGILANDTRPAEFMYDNLAIEANVIEASRRVGVEKLMFLGSSCIYPRLAPQPMAEDVLLTGPLEPTNQWYAVAKIAGLMMCAAYRRQYGSDFISAMPTNLYGPGDNFDPTQSHVVAALLIKTHRAKQMGADAVEIWGTGTPRREFLYVDDLADALVFLMKHYSAEPHVNVGTGSDVTIRDFAALIADVVGFRGGFTYAADKPDGTPRKLLDVGRMKALGWTAQTSLRDGLCRSYDWFLEHVAPTL
ncbi:MAG: GDP-L-fucose synthase [Alphaproteobacteria bacterium]|nr:GDP-L-fucose synthase [Alphaproteobacteria bacterium]